MHTITRPHAVSISSVTVNRQFDDGETYSDSVPDSTVIVPHAVDKADAIATALAFHREQFGIPTNVTLIPTAKVITAPIGMTIDSKSGTANWRGKVVS